jgi:tetratricopeptide (TPR) repeat protein
MNAATRVVAAVSFALALPFGVSPVRAQTPPGAGAAPAPPRVEVVPRQGLPGRDVALLLSGQQGGQIAVSMKVFPSASAGKPDRIPWVFDLPGFTLASMAEGDAIDLELAVYLVARGGEIAGHEEATLHISGVPASWQAAGGLKLLGYVDASRPPAELKVLVREPSSGAFGNWAMPVPTRAGSTGRRVDFGSAQVSDVQGGSGAMVGTGFEGMTGRSGLLALVAPDPPGAWLVAGIGGARPDAGEAPFSLAGKGALPATRPVVRPGSVLRVALLGESMPGDLEARARLVFSDGRTGVTCPARIMSRLPAPAGPFERIDVAVTLPADLPPGEHSLVVSCRPVGGIDAGSVGTFFRVPPAATTDPAVGWPGIPIDETGRAITLPKAGAAASPAAEDAPPQLKAAYREAVARYAADGSAESLRALAAFERDALAGGASGAMGRLASVERSVARTFAKSSAPALLGLCLVHLDLYREHSRDQAYPAIGHSRRIVEELTEMVASDAKDREGKRAAAGVLTVFAASLQAVGSYASAERLFIRAGELDGGDVAALMGRADILERVGDAKDTVGVLEKALALRPHHAEAQLRLGVNLRRIGDEGAARTTLTGCTAAGRPEWIRAVAWQELASMLLAGGQVSEAERLLREATAALPADPQLQVLLAGTLDRERRQREALTVVNAVVDHPAGGTPSARLRYSQPPRDDLDVIRQQLDAGRAQDLAALAAVAREDRP